MLVRIVFTFAIMQCKSKEENKLHRRGIYFEPSHVYIKNTIFLRGVKNTIYNIEYSHFT